MNFRMRIFYKELADSFFSYPPVSIIKDPQKLWSEDDLPVSVDLG